MSTISPEQWQEISPYLDEALGLADEQRANWLAALLQQNPALAARLQRLLAEHNVLAEQKFLEQSPIAAPLPAESAGQTVGAYTLIGPIGQGGMSTVWLAERSDGRFEGHVAVKFLNIALFGPAGQQRFQREGSILGRLKHPHIAHLMDAGVSATGHPYLVLEHVEGEHIDQYCDRRKLEVRARVRLFLDVLDAIAQAHSNLIVHRDIKPSNVLVTNDGQVKLLDFGIAKLMEDDTAAALQMTREGAGPLTPDYASPEQVCGGVQTTATDIYSLGALCYKLLTGRTPHQFGGSTREEMMAAICATDPPPASRINPNVPRDLDFILGKALRKEPGERYASVDAFADDLRAFLEWRPVRARSGNAWYRTRKFVRRYRLPIVAVALIISSLALGLVVANRERERAQRRFQQVRQLANKFIELDDSIKALSGTTRVRNRLVFESLRYLEALGAEAGDDPELALEIGNAYIRVAHVQGDPTAANLGQFAAAEQSLRRAEVFIEPVVAADSGNRTALILSATIAHDRMILADMGRRREEALRLAGKAAERLNRLSTLGKIEPRDVMAITHIYGNLAVECENARRFEDAIGYCRRALALIESSGAAQTRRSRALGVLAWALWQIGNTEQALQSAQQSRELAEVDAATGDATWRSNLVNALWREGKILAGGEAPGPGRTSDALAAFQHALDVSEELATKDPHDGLSRHNVAKVSLEIGNILVETDERKALTAYDHGLARIREARKNARTQRDEAELLAASSYPLRRLHREREAIQRIESAFRILREMKQYPADKIEPDSEADHAVRALGAHYAETGDFAKAVEIYQELSAKIMATPANPQNDLRDAMQLSRTWASLASLLRQTGRAEEAAQLDARRAQLWNHWNTSLPNHPFVLSEIAAVAGK